MCVGASEQAPSSNAHTNANKNSNSNTNTGMHTNAKSSSDTSNSSNANANQQRATQPQQAAPVSIHIGSRDGQKAAAAIRTFFPYIHANFNGIGMLSWRGRDPRVSFA